MRVPSSPSYSDIVQADQPVCWWRVGTGADTPNAVGGPDSSLMSPTGSGGNLPYGGPRASRIFNGCSSHCVGSTNSAGQGWATGQHTLPSATYTFEIWAFLSSAPSATSVVMGRYNQTAGSLARKAQLITVSSTRGLSFYGNGSTSNVATASAAFELNRWNHIVATVNEPTVSGANAGHRLWLNGQYMALSVSSYDGSGSIYSCIGMSAIAPGETTNYRSFPGYLAEAAIYPYTLHPSQIQAHYQAGIASGRRPSIRVADISLHQPVVDVIPPAVPVASATTMPPLAFVGPISQNLTRSPLATKFGLAAPAFVGVIDDTVLPAARAAAASFTTAKTTTRLDIDSSATAIQFADVFALQGPTIPAINAAVGLATPSIAIIPSGTTIDVEVAMSSLAFIGAIDDTAMPNPLLLQPTVVPPVGVKTQIDIDALDSTVFVGEPDVRQGPTPEIVAAIVGFNQPYVTLITSKKIAAPAAIPPRAFVGPISDTAILNAFAPKAFVKLPKPVVILSPTTLSASSHMVAPRASEGPTVTSFGIGVGFANLSTYSTNTPDGISSTVTWPDDNAIFQAGAASLAPLVDFPNRRYGVGPTADTIVSGFEFADETLTFSIENDGFSPPIMFPAPRTIVRFPVDAMGTALGFNNVAPWTGTSPDSFGGDTSFPPAGLTSSPSVSNNHIVLLRLDFDGATYIKPTNIDLVLTEAYNVELHANIEGEDSLIFSYSADSAHISSLRHDAIVEFIGRRYRIATIKDGRNADSTKFFDVECNSLAADLGTVLPNSLGEAGVSILPVFEEDPTTGSAIAVGKSPEHPAEDAILAAVSIEAGAKAILRWSSTPGWTLGAVEVDPAKPTQTYSMSGRADSVLASLRSWADITGTELYLDTINLTVSFLRPSTTPVGYRIEYAKNLLDMKREMQPPQTTRLWAYGRSGLDLKKVNSDKYYLENYSWYMSAYNITEAEARANFLKDGIWETDDQIDAQSLLLAAQKKLSELSQPTISYEVTVASFPDLGLPFVDLKLNDIVAVHDTDLGIDVQTKVVGMKRYLAEPWRDEIELSYLKPGLGSKEDKTSSADVNNFSGGMIGASTVGIKQINDTSLTELVSISLTAFATTPVSIGYSIIGQASEDCRLDIQFKYGDFVLYKPVREQLHQGWNTISGTFYVASIPEGSDNIVISARLYDAASVSLDLEEAAGNFYVYGQKIAGGGVTGTPRLTVSENVAGAWATLPKILDVPRSLETQTPLPFSDSGEVSLQLTEVISDDAYPFLAQVRLLRVGTVVTFPSVTVITS